MSERLDQIEANSRASQQQQQIASLMISTGAETLVRERTELSAKCADLEARVRAQETTIRRLREERNRHREDSDNFRALIHELDERLDESQVRLTNISADRNTAQSNSQRSQQQQDRLREQLHEANYRLDVNEAQINVSNEAIRSLNDQLLQAQSQLVSASISRANYSCQEPSQRRNYEQAFRPTAPDAPRIRRQKIARYQQKGSADVSDDEMLDDSGDQDDDSDTEEPTKEAIAGLRNASVSNSSRPINPTVPYLYASGSITLTPSSNGSFTMSVDAAKRVECTSDVIPDKILKKLRDQLHRWNQGASGWEVVKRSKEQRFVAARVSKFKTDWHRSQSFSCFQCNKKGQLCIVVEQDGLMRIIPRSTSDEAFKPHEEEYWLAI